MTYAEWKKKFQGKEETTQEGLQSSSINGNIVDIKFKSQKSSAEVREDKKTVIEA